MKGDCLWCEHSKCPPQLDRSLSILLHHEFRFAWHFSNMDVDTDFLSVREIARFFNSARRQIARTGGGKTSRGTTAFLARPSFEYIHRGFNTPLNFIWKPRALHRLRRQFVEIGSNDPLAQNCSHAEVAHSRSSSFLIHPRVADRSRSGH